MAAARRRIDRNTVAQLGQPVLRRRADEVPVEMIATPEFQALLDDMVEILQTAGGVGLAAPQVFDSRRLFLAAVGPRPAPEEDFAIEFFINPVLSECSSEKDDRFEGCLSFIELMVKVTRHRSLRVDYLDRDGQPQALLLSGFPARVVQHEYDHLDGVLTLDRARSMHDVIKASEYDDLMGDDE